MPFTRLLLLARLHSRNSSTLPRTTKAYQENQVVELKICNLRAARDVGRVARRTPRLCGRTDTTGPWVCRAIRDLDGIRHHRRSRFGSERKRWHKPDNWRCGPFELLGSYWARHLR